MRYKELPFDYKSKEDRMSAIVAICDECYGEGVVEEWLEVDHIITKKCICQYE